MNTLLLDKMLNNDLAKSLNFSDEKHKINISSIFTINSETI